MLCASYVAATVHTVRCECCRVLPMLASRACHITCFVVCLHTCACLNARHKGCILARRYMPIRPHWGERRLVISTLLSWDSRELSQPPPIRKLETNATQVPSPYHGLLFPRRPLLWGAGIARNSDCVLSWMHLNP